MTCVRVPPGSPLGASGRSQGAGPGIFISGRKGSPTLGPQGASCPSGPWGPGRDQRAREASQSRTKGLGPSTSPGNARSPPLSARPGSAVTLFIAAPRRGHPPPGPASPFLRARPSDLGASPGGTARGHGHPACPGLWTQQRAKQGSSFPPSTARRQQFRNSSWRGRKKLHQLCTVAERHTPSSETRR